MAVQLVMQRQNSGELCAGGASTSSVAQQHVAPILVQMAHAPGGAFSAGCSGRSSAAAAVTPSNSRKRTWMVCSSGTMEGQQFSQLPALKRSNTACSGGSNASTASAVDAGYTPDSACSSQVAVQHQEEQCQALLSNWQQQQQQQQQQQAQRYPQQQQLATSFALQQQMQQQTRQQLLQQLQLQQSIAAHQRQLQQQQQYQQQLQRQQQLQLQYKQQQQLLQAQFQQQQAATVAGSHDASLLLSHPKAAPKPQPQLLQTSLLAWAGSVLRAGCHNAYLLAQHIWARVQDSLDLMLLLSLGAHSPAHVAMLVCLWVASKLEDNRRNVMPCSKLAVATGMLPWGITKVELHIMDLIDWRPYQGWCGASCCVMDVS